MKLKLSHFRYCVELFSTLAACSRTSNDGLMFIVGTPVLLHQKPPSNEPFGFSCVQDRQEITSITDKRQPFFLGNRIALFLELADIVVVRETIR